MMWILNRQFLKATVCAAMTVIAPTNARAATTLIVNPAANRTDGIAKGMALWCASAATATQGRIACTAGNVHFPPESAAAALKAGQVDLICISHKSDVLRYRISRIGDLPMLGDFAETTSVAYQRIYDTTSLMANEHNGYKVLAVFTQPPAFLFTSQSPALKASLVTSSGLAAVATVSGTAVPGPGGNLAHPLANATLVRDGNRDDRQYRIATATEFLAFPGNASMHTALIVKGGRTNVSYVFALSQDKWDRLSENDRMALNRISGIEAARLLGRTVDAEESKANIGVRNAGVSFYALTRANQTAAQKDFATEEKLWVAQAKLAGIKHPTSLLATFREAISTQDDAE